MRLAQRLYEGVEIDGETTGLITYMRTDGIDIAPEAISDIRAMIGKNYGKEYVPGSPRTYQNKSKNAQEAHEAVRPTDPHRTPDQVAKYVDRDQARLYELIWNRAVASQMESAELERTTVDIVAKSGSRTIDLRATGQVVKFDGFLTLYQEGQDETPRRRRVAPPAGDVGKRDAHQTSDRSLAAFHRAAAALFRSRAGQAHGRARHRPALDLRLDPASAAGPRLCAHRQEAADPRRQGPRRRRLPGKLLPALRRIRFHRLARRAARSHFQQRDQLEEGAGGFLDRLHRRGQRHQGTAHHPGARRAQRSARAAYLPGARRRRRRAAVPAMRHRQAVAQSGTLRRLHRLLELSGMHASPGR